MAKSRKEKVRKERRRADARSAAEKAEMGGRKIPLKLPKGMSQFFYTDNKTYRLDYLEYPVGQGNPEADFDEKDPFYYHSRKYWVHKPVGADEQMVACLKKNWNEPCPMCEHLESIPREERWGSQKDLAVAISPKQRQIFALRDNDDLKKGVQIQETHYKFGIGEELEGKILAKERYKTFANQEGGRTVEATVRKNKKGGWDIRSLELEQRDEIPDEIMDKVPCLDDLIIKPTYEEFSKLYHQGKVAKKKKKDGDSDVDSDTSSEEEGSSEEGSSPEEKTKAAAKKVSDKKAKSKPKKDKDVATSSPVEPSDDDSEEEGSSEEGSDEEGSSEEGSDEEGDSSPIEPSDKEPKKKATAKKKAAAKKKK